MKQRLIQLSVSLILLGLATHTQAQTTPNQDITAVQQVYQVNQIALKKKKLTMTLACQSKEDNPLYRKVITYKNQEKEISIIVAEFSGDSHVIKWTYHYDQQARLRFIYAQLNGIQGKSEKRFYFTEQNKLIKEFTTNSKIGGLFGGENLYDPTKLSPPQDAVKMLCQE